MHIPDSWSPRSPGGRPHAYIRQLEPQVSWRAASCIYPTAGGSGLLAGGLMHISDSWGPRSPGGPPHAHIRQLAPQVSWWAASSIYPELVRRSYRSQAPPILSHLYPTSSTPSISQCPAPHTLQLNHRHPSVYRSPHISYTHQLDPPASVSVPLQGGDRSKKSNFFSAP